MELCHQTTADNIVQFILAYCHEPLVTEKMLRATTLTGSREEVMDSIQAMRKAGIKQVAIQAVTDPQATIETFAKAIIKRWK